VVPSHGWRRGLPELATLVADSAGEEVEKVEGLNIDRFVAADGWGNTGERPAGGAKGALPRRPSARWRSGLGGSAVVLGDSGDVWSCEGGTGLGDTS
jgi:hypothetical protein